MGRLETIGLRDLLLSIGCECIVRAVEVRRWSKTFERPFDRRPVGATARGGGECRLGRSRGRRRDGRTGSRVGERKSGVILRRREGRRADIGQ